MIWMAQISSVEGNKKNPKNLPTHPHLPSTTRGSCKAQTRWEHLCTATPQSSHLPECWLGKQTSFPSFHSRVSQKQLNLTSSTRGVCWKPLLRAGRCPTGQSRAHSGAAAKERMALSSQVFPAPVSNQDLSPCHTIVFTAGLPYKWCPTTYENINTLRKKKGHFFKQKESCTMLSSSGFLQLVLISSQEPKQAGAGLLESAWCHWSPIPPLNIGPHLQSLHFLPRPQIEIFLILVLLWVSPLASIAESHGSTHVDVSLKVRSFSNI